MKTAPEQTRRIKVYILGIIISLAAPFIPAFYFRSYLTDCYVISDQYIDQPQHRINIDAIRANPLFANVEHIKVPGQNDQVLFSKNNDIIRMVLVDTPESASQFVKKYDDDAQVLKTRKGIKITGTASIDSGANFALTTRFGDGKISFTQGFSRVVLQVLCDYNAFSKNYFERIGIVTENKAISEFQRWLCKNEPKVLFVFLGIYSICWVMVILKGGTWIAVVHPAKEVQPVPADKLESNLLKINELDVPFKLTQQKSDVFRAEWRVDKKWQGILEKENIKHTVIIDMKLNNERKAVSVIEKKMKLIKEKGVFTSKIKFEIFRGVTFNSYDAATTYGLSYADGKFNISGYSYKFDLQEMKNPLIEIVVTSGWKWEPHIFSL